MKNLIGPDTDIETSLKEYGIAWEIKEDSTNFYYGITHDDNGYTQFDWASFDNDIDIEDEFNWVDFEDIQNFAGLTPKVWKELPLTRKIQSIVNYYGYENTFGSSYTKGYTYNEVIEN